MPGNRGKPAASAMPEHGLFHGPSAFRFRLGSAADLPHCVALLPPGFRAPHRVRSQLVELWHQLLATEARTFAIVEDQERAWPDNIEAFGMSAFLTDNFMDEYLKAPEPYLAALVYERMLANSSVILTPAQLRAANTTTGIHVVSLHAGMRNWDFSHPRTAQAAIVASTAFHFLHSGYRVHTVTGELYGQAQARFVEMGGFRLVRDFANDQPQAFSHLPSTDHPHLAMVRREWIELGAGSPFVQIFRSPPARIGFSAAERRLLERALMNESDAGIAVALGIAGDTIKKTWRNIHNRVEREASFLVPAANPGRDGIRGQERRGRLLDYLRTHMEELRPGGSKPG